MTQAPQQTQTQQPNHSTDQQPSGSTYESKKQEIYKNFQNNGALDSDGNIITDAQRKGSPGTEPDVTKSNDKPKEEGAPSSSEASDNIFDALEKEGTKSLNPNAWEWGEGVKGDGEKPDWLRKEFKSAQDQAKAYNSLVKKFGDFKGAPDNYDFKNVENTEFHVHAESENAKKFVALAKEMQLSQDGFDKLLNLFNKSVAPTFKGQGQRPIDSSQEIAKLGEGGREKVQILDTWLRNNHTDQYGTFRKMMRTADDINALWSLRQMTTGNEDKHTSIMHRSNPTSAEQQQKNLRAQLKEAIDSKDPAKKDAVMQKYRETFSNQS